MPYLELQKWRGFKYLPIFVTTKPESPVPVP